MVLLGAVVIDRCLSELALGEDKKCARDGTRGLPFGDSTTLLLALPTLESQGSFIIEGCPSMINTISASRGPRLPWWGPRGARRASMRRHCLRAQLVHPLASASHLGGWVAEVGVARRASWGASSPPGHVLGSLVPHFPKYWGEAPVGTTRIELASLPFGRALLSATSLGVRFDNPAGHGWGRTARGILQEIREPRSQLRTWS